MKEFLDEFKKIKVVYDNDAARKSGLICITSVFEGCPGVKLYRASWMSGKSGIFFSVWTDSDSETLGRLHYNIHALKLRRLKSYVITSRNFAEEFRRNFKVLGSSWPNVRVDYGPLNLMQGWIEFREATFEPIVLSLMKEFAGVCPIIDRLLEERIAPARRRR